MRSYMGVAATSVDSPYLIHLCYKPPSGPIKAKLSLVGKGSTLDREQVVVGDMRVIIIQAMLQYMLIEKIAL
ncbi:hypothetical protein F383_25699 [Gossypium arboreum]|nr:hypothetical protein PVK06_014000 [Gossypium arboreum]KHG02437.1 hypothetical protein F383_25699 [Gossypium arboreum]TYI25591.1 hypothetical protein ES332_A05G060200v1 [Gossypium tomentosum]